jgi:hypothetical protein
MTGIGLGWARQSDRPAVKFLAPVGGYLAAMFLHFIWNASADLGAAFFAAYLLLMFPTLLAVCVLIFFALKREGKLVREQLERDVRNGLLPEEELELLCTVGGRRRACREASLRGGAAAVRTRRAFHQIASEVAFSRNRIARGVTRRGPSAAELEAAYAQLLLQLQPTWAPPPQERSEFGTGDYRPPER